MLLSSCEKTFCKTIIRATCVYQIHRVTWIEHDLGTVVIWRPGQLSAAKSLVVCVRTEHLPQV